MSRNSIAVVILLAVFSLGLIIAGQVFWVRQAYSIQERQFNDRVVIALSAVVDRILIMNRDSALTEPVVQKESNFFVANINDTPEPYLLETLLKEEFEESNIKDDFEYGIYDCFNDSIVFGGRVIFNEPLKRERAIEIQHKTKLSQDGHYFGVLFPNKTSLILKQLDFWMYSSIVIILIVIFFFYSIFLILRQKRLSEVKNDFINNMTHELKTPIATISLSTEALVNPEIRNQPERFNQYISIIRNESSRLRSQVDKVLQIASLSPKKVDIHFESIDFHETILKAVNTFSAQVESEGGRFITRLNASNPIINGDKVHITNVIYNLIDNAIKYNDKEPEIELETWNDHHAVLIRVKDNGIGIEQKKMKLIFDKFYRVPTGNVHDVKGFGLGLFYVKTIVKAHKGKILVESKPTEGTTFTLKFKNNS